MPCTSTPRRGQTLQERMAEVQRSLKRLEQALSSGAVAVGIAPNGAIVFRSWKDRDDITDVCAFRALTAEGSWALRQALARAEAQAGRKANPQAVAAGWHSHDSGKTWGTH